MATSKYQSKPAVPCCPDMEKGDNCNSLEFLYRLTHFASLNDRRIPVEVSVRVKLELCRGALAKGNLAYSTTLFPGEKVRLFTMDRRSRFSFDSESQLSYRHVQTNEEQYYMSSMSNFMTDLTVSDEGSAKSQSEGESRKSGEVSGAIDTLISGPSVSVNGSFNSFSTSSFMRELSRHAEGSHDSTVQGTRASSSVSVGEVSQRTHAEGESESHFESASRVFSNPNQCHALTYYFYQIDQKQTLKFSIVSLNRRVIDSTDNSIVTNRIPKPTESGKLSVMPTAILADNPKRLQIEEADRTSIAARAKVETSNLRTANFATFSQASIPLDGATRAAALKAVDDDLIKAGLLDSKTRQLNREFKKELEFEVTTSIPTPGLLVRGCLDDCDICEPELKESIKLDLERKKLKNELLKKKISLLENAQEYRCCPTSETENED